MPSSTAMVPILSVVGILDLRDAPSQNRSNKAKEYADENDLGDAIPAKSRVRKSGYGPSDFFSASRGWMTYTAVLNFDTRRTMPSTASLGWRTMLKR